MKWRGGGFDNLRKHGKELGQTARIRTPRKQSVGYLKDLFEVCQHRGCGLSRLHHERSPLLPDHDFVAAKPPKSSESESRTKSPCKPDRRSVRMRQEAT